MTTNEIVPCPVCKRMHVASNDGHGVHMTCECGVGLRSYLARHTGTEGSGK
jgi:hypothetical protein